MAKPITATIRYLRMAPRKVRLAAKSVRGLSVNEAEARLLLAPQRAAKPLLKLLRSAVANAKSGSVEVANLRIASLVVNQGPMLKRYMMRARGGASPIQKKMSHVTVTLTENPLAKAPRFTIPVIKKEKKSGDEKRERRQKAPAGENAAPEKTKSGVLKKVFRRKTGTAD